MKPWWRRWARRALVWATIGTLILAAAYESGLVERWMRRKLISSIQQGTGARVEIGGFHFDLWSLRARIDNLTLHGLEAAVQPPLFHADRIDVDIRVVSFFGRKIALDELIVEKPKVAVRLDHDGRSNVPSPRRAAGNHPWRATLFDLRIGRLELRDGSVAYNDAKVPLDVGGRDCNLGLRYDSPAAGGDSYIGNVSLRQVRVAAKRDLPFPFDLTAKFTLHRDAFELDQMSLKLARSNVDLQASLPSFSSSDWDFKYRGRLSLADVRSITRQPK